MHGNKFARGMQGQGPLILLKDGAENAQGSAQVLSNIKSCQVVADAIRTTLGPRGMDKLIIQPNGEPIISNDGATVLKHLEVVHPAAKTLVDISQSQDSEVGDGTTTVTLLAAEFLKQAVPFLEEGVHPQLIVKAYRKAVNLSVKHVESIAVRINKDQDPAQLYDILKKCAMTTLNSKLVSAYKDFFGSMVVDAVMCLGELLPLSMIGIKKVAGGGLEESKLIQGVAFKKSFSYAGFEMQEKHILNPKIALLNVELELKSEKENAEVRVTNVTDYQSIVDAEWNILYEKLDNITESGAKIVLSKLPIGDVATQYFADRGIFCAGRVQEGDLRRTMKACGGSIQATTNDLNEFVLGECGDFEERQVGSERFNFFTGCPKAKTCTILIRGGAKQFMDETERSLHDAIMIVRRALKFDSIVAGGGAVEMEVSKHLRQVARQTPGKEANFICAFAKALEIIPRQLCTNGGLDATELLSQLRAKHAQGEIWAGIDLENDTVSDNMARCVWEPSLVKLNALRAAGDAAALIISVDQTIKNKKSTVDGGGARGGRGRGRGGR